MASRPSPRWAHFSAPVEGKFYVCGGRTADFEKDKNKLETTMHIFNLYSENWEDKVVNGSVFPSALYHGVCTSAGHCLYLYGGLDITEHYHSSLYQFDTRTSTWNQLVEHGPRAKEACGMVIHDNKLVLFGGYGYFSTPQPGEQYVKDSKWYVSYHAEMGWTNELHTLDLDAGEYVHIAWWAWSFHFFSNAVPDFQLWKEIVKVGTKTAFRKS